MVSGLCSAQRLVPSGVPVLGPVLFDMVLNDLEEVMECTPASLADDTWLEREAANIPEGRAASEGHKEAGGLGLQEHSESSKGKCTALHLGRKVPWPRYGLGTCQMENSSVGKHPGPLVKDRAKLFTVAHSRKMRDNECKLKKEKSSLDTRKTFLSGKRVKHGEKLAVQSPSLEITDKIKIKPDKALSNLI